MAAATAANRAAERFRLWWITRAGHLTPTTPAGRARQTRTAGAWTQAVADMIDWVEHRNEPPPSTTFAMSPDVAVVLPAAAADRFGVQPVVSVMVNGALQATVSVNETVRLEAHAEVPPHAGTLTAAAWDLDGVGGFDRDEPVADGTTTAIVSHIEHAWEHPGTYPVTFRVTSNRHGSPDASHPQVEALDRVRVTVIESEDQ